MSVAEVADPTLNNDKDSLRGEIQNYSALFHASHGRSYVLGNVFLVVGALLGFGATVAGLYDEAKLAAVFGALTALHAALYRIFNFQEKAAFKLQVANQADSLVRDLQYAVKTREDFAAARKSYEALQLYARSQFPVPGTEKTE